MAKGALFTIILIVYRRLEFTRQALKGIMDQTYKNLEIVVVCNGAIPEITEHVLKAQTLDSRIKIVHFKENQFSNDDLELTVRVCFNAGLEAATGEYVYMHYDDDLLSNDYVEKMALLFQENPHCTSAAGIIKNMDPEGRLLDKEPRVKNYRPRYMPGHLLALNLLCEGKFGGPEVMYAAPCASVFTLRREDIIKMGGYRFMDYGFVYGIIPFGITGFDETAVIYWRRHGDQTNKATTLVGITGTPENIAVIKDWKIEERWQVFGKDVSRYAVQRMFEKIYADAGYYFVFILYNFRFKGCVRVVKECGHSFYFWRNLPSLLWTERRQFWWFLRPKVRRIFEAHPWLTQKAPFLGPLKNRAYK